MNYSYISCVYMSMCVCVCVCVALVYLCLPGNSPHLTFFNYQFVLNHLRTKESDLSGSFHASVSLRSFHGYFVNYLTFLCVSYPMALIPSTFSQIDHFFNRFYFFTHRLLSLITFKQAGNPRKQTSPPAV